MPRLPHIFLLPAAFFVLAGCGDDGSIADSGPASDSGADTNVTDTGPADTGIADTGVGDTGPDPVPDGCVAAPETCNGIDDDCDGFIDEGSGRELTCGAGQECVAGVCICPVGSMCGASCVDLDTDRDHCGTCDTACPAGQVCGAGTCCDAGTEPVDLLFMVDNSNSMTEEQASLVAAFPRFIAALTTGDADGDGTPDFPPVTDIHVGVITSDMGTGGFGVPTCSESNFGDDGVLRTAGNTSIAGCSAVYPSFLSWTTGDDTGGFAADAACVASVGTGGCGFEQPLEAVLKAVTPSTSTTTFVSGSTGHADGANAGFLRPDSVLALVIVTDEEDCSASDPDVYNPMSIDYTGDLNLRCFNHPAALHPISRFVSGLLATRGRTGDLVYAVIAGVPLETVPASGTPDYEAMLAHADMLERIDPTTPTRLAPSCNVAGRGLAFPPRRIVNVARELSLRGTPTTVQSICQADYTGAITAIADRVGAVVGMTCD